MKKFLLLNTFLYCIPVHGAFVENTKTLFFEKLYTNPTQVAELETELKKLQADPSWNINEFLDLQGNTPLVALINAWEEEDDNFPYATLDLLLRYGADPSSKCHSPSHPHIKASSFFEKLKFLKSMWWPFPQEIEVWTKNWVNNNPKK
jgi:hypothetical protein